ncbi:MAG: T9SS type A sorting domain-containing protein [Candidatus Cloacimonetes bacterium]|nr:T9SS type A sorting domain-containing protein [Candidatus Cloacimonadota bacterium]
MKRFLALLIIFSMALVIWAEDVTFLVNMNYQIVLDNFDPEVDFVDIAGSFNEWGATPMVGEDLDEDGIYEMTVTGLEVGFLCEYKFRINGSWNTSEFPGGGPNRQYTVVAGENIVGHWYNDEQLPSVFADVVFTITDGTESYLDIKFKSSFDGWVLHQMMDDGVAPDAVASDHVWTVLVEDIPNGMHTWGAIEDDGSQWGIWLIEGDDLEYTVDDDGNVSGQTDYIIDPGSAQDVTVTYSVDVSLLPVVGEITIAGSFNSWNITDDIMTDDDNDMVYTIDILIPAGSPLNQQYKYLNDGVYEDIENRSYLLDDSVTEMILPIDFFNNANPADYLTQSMVLTIYVDMEDTVFDSVAVCGSVAPLDWDFAAHNYPLTLHEGTIWTTDINFMEGAYRYLNFKFAIDGQDLEAGFDENHSCTLDESETAQSVWCVYGVMGPTNGEDEDNISLVYTLSNYPNPFNPETTIAYQLPANARGELSIYNLKGQLVKSWTGLNGNGSMVWDGRNALGRQTASGLYFAVVKAGNWQQTRKMMMIK